MTTPEPASESTSKPTDDEVKARAALHRAMPVTRMLDYGMDYWDATQLAAAPLSRTWDAVATELADAQVARATAATERGDRETAVASYRRATAALYFAQLAFNADSSVKRDLYGRLTRTYRAAAELDDELRVEQVSVPLGSGACSAWLVRPRSARPSPVVVVVGGQSGWGVAYHSLAVGLARRGMSTVLLEAPGQGETRMLAGIHLDGRVDEAFSATLDTVTEMTGYSGPFGVWGNSFGGLLAARAAVHDSRFGACCINGATATPLPLPFRAAREQTHALLGVDTDAAAERVLRALWMDPAVDRMSAALLVLHGGADALVTLEQQQVFLGLSERSTLRVWDDGEHTMYNHAAERIDVVGDWFRTHLTAGLSECPPS